MNYLMRNIDLACINSFIPGEKISNNLEKLSQILRVNISEEMNFNLSNNELSLWGEMFMNLNSCPSFYVKLYSKAIYGIESRIAMLASNVIKKAKLDFKNKALKIFLKISSVLGFQHISSIYDENESFDKNIVDVKGEIILAKEIFRCTSYR